MKKIVINGKKILTGNVEISGSKNSAVSLVPAALLSSGIVEIDNIPNISDIDALVNILEYLGATVSKIGSKLVIDSSLVNNKKIPSEISSKLRASYYFTAVLLSKYKKVEMYFPGGCSIGSRPIDQTLKAFESFGAKINIDGDLYTIMADKLMGSHIYLDMPSVGATVNAMLVASMAIGTTIIDNAAREPEIVNLAVFLNNMGANIKGAGTSEITILGVDNLNNGFIEVIPDRIEAGTYLIAGALCGKNYTISNIIPEHIESLIMKLEEMGSDLIINDNSITINKVDNLKNVNVKTLGYPGFPTDLQQPLTVLLTQTDGVSVLEETIYENRFQNIEYLKKMGADVKIDGRKIYLNKVLDLKGDFVIATDLRAGACMVLAGLIAEGTTVISNIEHILRGYDNIIEKLRLVGADILLIEE